MIPQDWQGRLKIDYMTHLGAELIKKQSQKKQQRILEMKQIKEMQKENASLTTNHKHTTEL